jgi:arylsulfatase A-like enzyme
MLVFSAGRACVSAGLALFNHLSFIVAVALLVWTSPARAAEFEKPRFNVLFVAVDDLRPELGCYGISQIKSPNIDALAKQGLQFNRAYCQYALCNPSRSSLLTGRRPDSIRIYDLATFVRTHVPDVVTLPQLFKQNGYECRSFGKVFHVSNGNHEDKISWSVPAWHSPPDDNPEPERGPTDAQRKAAEFVKRYPDTPAVDARANILPYQSPNVADDQLLDGQVADKAVRAITEIKDEPFFLAVGFYRPHMPWVAPKKYWDLYKPEEIQFASNQSLPEGAPAFASNQASEFRSYKGVPREGPIPENIQREAIHGYYASVSYTDAQIGKVLSELQRLGLRDKTIVILWGDHGYQLGEHGTWNKRTNWELAARVPLIISVPGQAHAGEQTNALVELLDMYPTLAELCGLKPPTGLEGRSFVPLLKDPDQPWKDAAFTIIHKPIPELGDGFGRAIRTDRYRFVEWSGPNSDKRIYELYDEQADPQENVNIANRPENAALVAELVGQLHGGSR